MGGKTLKDAYPQLELDEAQTTRNLYDNF